MDSSLRSPETHSGRKARGAFFTPPSIAEFLADWAVGDNPGAKLLDPTCGEAVFLLGAARKLRAVGAIGDLREQLFGIDLHGESLSQSRSLLSSEGFDASLIEGDFFGVPSPEQLGCPVPLMDGVIGNPPFIRYQIHKGQARRQSAQAALRQGVHLSGLASSWASVLVHACAFLRDEGRLAMVLPAELLTVHYAEPIRRWLRRRFAAVNLILFDQLQFEDALENVVLIVAKGSGGCDAFSLYHVNDADDLSSLGLFDHFAVTPNDEGKWTDLLLPVKQRQLFKRISDDHFVPLSGLGSTELGIVTGANSFFAISETTRREFEISEANVQAISPPGTRHLHGMSFSRSDWESLKEAGERVWLLCPSPNSRARGLHDYIAQGEAEAVDKAYKCQIRSPWWRPPLVPAPDLFFTYMSHRFPRLIANTAGVTFLNSMHGVTLKRGTPKWVRAGLPLLSLNSVTMLGAELFGRSYGGGVLKMEPREAAALPVPSLGAMKDAWSTLEGERAQLDRELRDGRWTGVLARVDEVLLRDTLRLDGAEVREIHEAARSLRERRLRREIVSDGVRGAAASRT